MKIGLAYDLKGEVALNPACPEDALEEYDVPETIAAIAAALESLGHSVVRLGGGRELLLNLLRHSVDFVFNIAEGRGNYRSREAQVPAVLEMLGIPYSASDPQCLAICLDKPLTKQLAQSAGVRTPKWRVIADTRRLENQAWLDSLPLPAFVKPAYEGSSKGIRLSSKADSHEQVVRIASNLLDHYQQPVMVEEFISGHEVTVGVVGLPPRVLGVMRVLPTQGHDPDFVYALEVKREWEKLVAYECPARLPPQTIQEITEGSLRAFAALGCRDTARLDFRVDMTGRPFLLEVNPLPGLRPGYSDLPIIAQKMGYEYAALISLILESALKRQGLCSQRSPESA